MASYLSEDGKKEIKKTKYQLLGLLEHEGETGTKGHYTAVTLRDGKFLRFNDEKITNVSEKDALTC